MALMDEVLDRLSMLTGAIETRQTMANFLLERTERLLAMRPYDARLLDAKGRLLMELGSVHGDREMFGAAVQLYADVGDDFASFVRRPAG